MSWKPPKTNMLDRAINAVAPVWGARRMAAKTHLSVMASSARRTAASRKGI